MVAAALGLVLAPLAAFLLIIFVTRRARALSAALAIAAAALSLGLSLYLLVGAVASTLAGAASVPLAHASIQWLSIPSIGRFRGLEIAMGILVDPLSAAMSVIVSLVAFLVMVYSLGYMKGDKGFSRYYAYLSLFAFSMLGLVVADNYFQTFAFWELVGFCSYLLIGFWFEKKSAADASRKAFVTNRWADFGFMIGIILLFVTFGSFDFGELSKAIAGERGSAILALIAALIFVGPVGKSAQFPFHVWLPDAMEGPTPVSALIHAATMVAAGVYLIARGFVLFSSVSAVMETMAYLGGFTALFSASIALVQKDIKRILAYSTLSQLGYMFMALGVGSMSAGMFHLTTHAFFKALLFLGAGSVIHATSEQDIFKMGGLGRKMKITTWTFVIGALALSGVFPLAGFWSKDEILLASLGSGHIALYILGLCVAFMTAFYMFRLIFTAFGGTAYGGSAEGQHVHESGPAMTIPLMVLAFLAVVAGLIGSPWFEKAFGISFGSFIFFGESEATRLDLSTAAISTLAAGGGIFLAWVIYGKKILKAHLIAATLGPLYRLLDHKFYIDEIYGWVFAKVMLGGGRVFDWVDHQLIDGFFDGLGWSTRLAGRKLRLTQSGRLQGYALVIFAAVAIATVAASTGLLGGFLK